MAIETLYKGKSGLKPRSATRNQTHYLLFMMLVGTPSLWL